MKIILQTLFTIFFLLFTAPYANAHFGMLIPDSPIVTADQRSTTLTLSFSHPFQGVGMDFAKPAAFYVLKEGKKSDLLPELQKTTVMDHAGWQTSYFVKRPGVYQFVMEPVPYWEPTEDRYIIHYTKVIIPAFGAEDGWEQPAGLPTEIIPLLRPFGNYAGNTFTGLVLNHGDPATNTRVEVELYNQGQKYKAASDYHITQVVHTDDRGIFVFACPYPGWWGFAALSTADYFLTSPLGEKKTVEVGAVLWIYMNPLQ